MGRGNRPAPEFRREAVRLALTSGRTRREIAEAASSPGRSALPAAANRRAWSIWRISARLSPCRTASTAARACIVAWWLTAMRAGVTARRG